MKSFSVIIPTLNEEAHIGIILSDLLPQTAKPNEIIVVDGYSKDKTKAIIQKHFPSVKVLSCPANVSSQRNWGAKNATGKVLVFLDADTKLSNSNFLKQVVSILDNSKQIICPYYLPYKSSAVIFSIYLFFNTMFFLFQKISPSGAGSCIIINSRLFQTLGGFNHSIKFEDIELIRRASKLTKFAMAPNYIWVSDRRFKKYGVLRTLIQYLFLSALFLCNQFNYSAGFSYQFGKYNKK